MLEIDSYIISDLLLFLIDNQLDNTISEFVAVLQNSHRSQSDHKKLMTSNSHELEKMSTTSGLVCLQPTICK